MDEGFVGKGWIGIRGARAGVCTLIVYGCALIPTRAQTSTDTTKKPATTTSSSAKKTTTTHHHKSTAKPGSSTTSKSGTKSGATHTASSGSRSSHKKKPLKAKGQQKIDPARAQAIQEALIREHYLSGEPVGTWNQASEDAMRRYQGDHGWQTKEVPDSRALIKLGLGPSNDHLLNPESAMITRPDAPHAASLTPVSHSADPGASMNPTPADSAPAASDHDATSPK